MYIFFWTLQIPFVAYNTTYGSCINVIKFILWLVPSHLQSFKMSNVRASIVFSEYSKLLAGSVVEKKGKRLMGTFTLFNYVFVVYFNP